MIRVAASNFLVEGMSFRRNIRDRWFDLSGGGFSKDPAVLQKFVGFLKCTETFRSGFYGGRVVVISVERSIVTPNQISVKRACHISVNTPFADRHFVASSAD